MPRQPRSTGEYLHLIVRGNGKQILFEEPSDYQQYLSYMDKYAQETGISILAYCLMENHVHLLVRDTAGSVSVFMKKTGVSYAQYYNKKYERTGHLFQDTYKSETIAGDAYLLLFTGICSEIRRRRGSAVRRSIRGAAMVTMEKQAHIRTRLFCRG